MRNPIAVKADEFLDAFEEKRLWNFRHREASGGTIQAAEIFARAEQRDAAVCGAMRLEALENGLAIMEGSQRGGKRDRSERNDLRLLPGTRFPIGDKHVVAEGGAELGSFAQGFREA